MVKEEKTIAKRNENTEDEQQKSGPGVCFPPFMRHFPRVCLDPERREMSLTDEMTAKQMSFCVPFFLIKFSSGLHHL